MTQPPHHYLSLSLFYLPQTSSLNNHFNPLVSSLTIQPFMGCSISSSSSSSSSATDDYSARASTAVIVAADGSLLQYSNPTTVAEVIGDHTRAFVICDSDKLFFDAFPPAMPPEAKLELGQLYFLLPASELGLRLSGTDMAALAGRASTALRRAADKQGRRIWRPRVMPIADSCRRGLGNGGGGGGGSLKKRRERKGVVRALAPFERLMRNEPFLHLGGFFLQ